MMDIDLKGEGRWASSRRAPYEFSIKSWKQWADKHNAELFILSDLLVDHNEMGICWQRYYLFDILEDAECPACRILLKVGEYVCWGVCFNCLEEDFENFYLESAK